MFQFLVYTDSHGEFRWRLQNNKGVVLARSVDGYNELSLCMHDIHLVKTTVVDATVVETD